ncbi:hypothetical protein [Tunturiibacter lichenicola]|uniref:hypothetical protein n=1 Tax=Tunturiibacter lichenicola TaxID=2051959 RepID=UPI0021B24D4C|nr:hypothetical protein [Edaphobacter lichenicola]
MKRLVAFAVLMFGSLGLVGQQQTKTTVDSEGNKGVMDTTTGWTVTAKGGKVTHMSVADITSVCNDLDDPLALAAFRNTVEWAVTSDLCENWGELQPKTRIEQVPFLRLITRLLLVTPPSTDFARYRGLELKSGAESKTYDAIIVPNDLGHDASCTIEEESRNTEGMLYTYQCSMKTSSFPDAIRLKDHLVLLLKSLDLDEDQVREHGLSAHARSVGYCAPSGECLEDHIYVTAKKDWKILQIEATPTLTRDPMADLSTMQYGHHSAIIGIASDSADVSFQIMSVGPNKAASVGHGK